MVSMHGGTRFKVLYTEEMLRKADFSVFFELGEDGGDVSVCLCDFQGVRL